MASTAPVVSAWIASTRREMSSVARAVSCASSFTSPATTAKPLPASPARAASMVALQRQQVGLLGDRGDHLDDRRDLLREVAAACRPSPSAAAMPTALPATWAAAFALWAISRIADCICSEPAATVPTLRETSPARRRDLGLAGDALDVGRRWHRGRR